MALTFGSSQRKFTVSTPPCTTLRTPLGIPTSFASSARIIIAPGVLSEGLITQVFPAAIARGNIHSGIIAGKLNGQIPETTPRGARIEYVSISLEIGR